MNNQTPVLILNCKIGGLAILRSLGPLGIPIHVVEADRTDPALRSTYITEKFIRFFDETKPQDYLDFVLQIGKRIGRKAILIPTNDELAVFVAENAAELKRYFLFPENDPTLIRNLISKKGMFGLARDNGVPTPQTLFPENISDVEAYADQVEFPVMLKGIHGNRLMARTGTKMVIVNDREELITQYRLLEDPTAPNLMLQQYIPGDDDQIYIFNGYFDGGSDCPAGFTGHKIRQYPVHVGCASLAVCKWNQTVYDATTAFMKTIGYRGILDIGYRYDPRDGQYKVLDINPRVGQAFRIFVAEDDSDVVKTLYRDLTGQPVPAARRREGRRWIIEDYDLESSLDYFREGTLGFAQWVRSYRNLEEGAWFDLRDPAPFMAIAGRLIRRGFQWIDKRVFADNPQESTAAPPAHKSAGPEAV